MEKQRKPKVYTTATAHLDTVWNWDLDQTVREFIPNTFNGNFALFEKYPEYSFNFEGAYRYELIKEFYPAVYEKLKQYIADGRWHVTGSAWENGDVISVSPEGLFRNFLYGNRFFEKEFGKKTTDIYLPDCFGFSQVLPSVGAHMGLNSFSTAKLIWSDGNYRPFDIGVWQGVNGDSVVAYLNPGQYMSHFDEKLGDNQELMNYVSHMAVRKCMKYYGVGDMGGAPTEDSVRHVCESIRDKEANVEVVSGYASQMTDELTAEEYEALPRYQGDLLMTTHAVGSYTSLGGAKYLNRRNELLADAAERFNCVAALLGVKDYPQARMEDIWKKVIRHQFHDDITGTSTHAVYKESFHDYFVCLNQLRCELASALERIAANVPTDDRDGLPVVLFNPSGYDRESPVELTLPVGTRVNAAAAADGTLVPVQSLGRCENGCRVLFTARVPATGYTVYYLTRQEKAPVSPLSVTETTLQNERYTVEINADGDISRVYDRKNDREILAAPVQLQLLRNSYTDFGSWEIAHKDVLAQPRAVVSRVKSIRVTESGPVRVAVEIVRTCGESTFVQTVSLTAGGRLVQVDNRVDWHERCTLLKAAFKVTVPNGETVYDIGLGRAVRPNSNDRNYEYPVHRFAAQEDTEGGYTVAVLNNCKYGMDKPRDDTLRLTLIHTPEHKWSDNARQDMQDHGHNIFSYAIMGEAGDWQASGVVQAAEDFNQPLLAVRTDSHPGTLSSADSFMAVSTPQVEVKAMKKAEDSAAWAVRVYEAYGRPCQGAALTCGGRIVSAVECDGNEIPKAPATVDNGRLVFDMKPYEVKTFLVTVDKAAGPVAVPAYVPAALTGNCIIAAADEDCLRYGFGNRRRLIPRQLIGDSLTVGGVPYALTLEGDKVAGVLADGRTLSLPQGAQAVYLLAASVDGDADFTLKVGEEDRHLAVEDAFANIGCWDLLASGQHGFYHGDTVAYTASHIHDMDGDHVYGKFHLFSYRLEVAKGTETLTLPRDGRLLVAAVTAETAGGHAALCSDPVTLPAWD